MKKYFNELNQEEIRKVLEKNDKLFYELSNYIYEDKMYWQESMAQNDQEYCNLSEEEIWNTIDKTIDDQQFTEEMRNCFDYYLSHNRKECN